MSVTGTNVSPIPIDCGMSPGSTVETYDPSTVESDSRRRPMAAMTIPITDTVRTPIRLTNCCASPAPIMMPAVTGRNASPASSGE
jgi:hypothetical protein